MLGRGVGEPTPPHTCGALTMELLDRHPIAPGTHASEHARRPRILFLSCHRPWPAISGGRRREWELLGRLRDAFDVHLLVVSKTEATEADGGHALAQACSSFDVFPADPRGDREAVPAEVRRHHCPRAALRVAQLTRRGAVDLIHVEGYYLMQHLPASRRLPVVLVEQNVEYELAYQRAAVADPGPGRVDLFARALRTRAAERRAWRSATRVVAVTDDDRRLIKAELPGVKVGVVPDGADHLATPTAAAAESRLPRPGNPLVVLVANFAYGPNIDAANHFCLDILPRLRRTAPDVITWLVGNAPPDEVRALAGPTVTVTGRVDEIAPYLDAADVVVCPLRIGGGIKVKTIEALRRGRPIVSTPVGAQGLPAQARAAMRIESDPERFAGAIAELLADPRRREDLAQRARCAGRCLPSWDDAAHALRSIYDDMLRWRVHGITSHLALAGDTLRTRRSP